MKKILFFYPALTDGKSAPTLYTAVPLSVAVLAAQFDPSEFEVEILDGRLKSYTQQEIKQKCENALFVGISAITSQQITNGLAFAQTVKGLYPHLPILWGGWHASLMPEETIRHPLCDMVVVGQGERILPEIARCLRDAKRFDCIPNLLYRDAQGQIVRTPVKRYADFQLTDNMQKAYRALDLTPYLGPQWGNERVVGYESSRGCPCACAFCSISALFCRKWHGLPAKSVVRDLIWLKQTYEVDAVHFFDNNFFVDKNRAFAIARGLCEAGCPVRWDGTVIIRQFLRFTAQELETLRRGGLYRVIIGAESGDEEVLSRIHKPHRNEEVLEAVARCKAYGLWPSLSFMVGFPWNPRQDTQRTIELIQQIKRIDSQAEILLFLFSPYLGTPLYEVAKERGMAFPHSLEGWARFTYDQANTPWVDERLRRSIDRYLYFFGTKQQTQAQRAFFEQFGRSTQKGKD